MLRRCRLLILCTLLLHNAVYAGKSSGSGTITATDGTVLAVQNILNPSSGFTVNVSPAATAEGIVNLTAGNLNTSSGTSLTGATAGVNFSTNTLTAASQTSLGSNATLNSSVVVTGAVAAEISGGTGTVTIGTGGNLSTAGVLTTPVAAGGGTVTANGNLKVGDNNKLLATSGGSSTINGNKQSVTLGTLTQNASSNITMQNMADLNFLSKYILTGQWTFTGNAYVSGNGNILDLSLGGTIRVHPNTVLSLSDMKIRGLGLGKIILDDPTAQIRTSFIEIEMNRSYSFTTGGIYTEGRH